MSVDTRKINEFVSGNEQLVLDYRTGKAITKPAGDGMVLACKCCVSLFRCQFIARKADKQWTIAVDQPISITCAECATPVRPGFKAGLMPQLG